MISHGKDIKIFTGNANPKLAEAICKQMGTTLGEAEVGTFSDGEIFVSLYETVRGSEEREGMEQFLRTLNQLPELQELIHRVEEGGCPAAVNGLQPVQRACVGAALTLGTGRPAVFLCAGEREAQQLAGDLKTLLHCEPLMLLSREWQMRAGAVGSRGWEQKRLAALYALTQGEERILVTTADALMARTLSPEQLRDLTISLEIGQQVDLAALAEQLTAAGYVRCEQVEGVGQFALRGGILDVFSPLMEQPVRCEFFDDEIDAMGSFDPGTQRRVKNVKSALLLPAAEVLPAVRRRDPGPEPPADAGGAGRLGGAGPHLQRHACPGRSADRGGGPVRRVRVASAPSGLDDRGTAYGLRHKTAEVEEGVQSAEDPVLYGPDPRGTWWFMPTTASGASPASTGCRWMGWRRTISRSTMPAGTASMSQ